MFQKFIEEVCDILKTVARDMGWSGEDLSLDYYDKISDVSSSLAFKISRKDKKSKKCGRRDLSKIISFKGQI